MIGPAAMKGPTPGIARAPIPANNPSVPPTTAPVLTPAVTPSGAFVAFSVPISLEPRFSGIKAEIFEAKNPSLISLSVAKSAAGTVVYIPKTAVFLSSISSPLGIVRVSKWSTATVFHGKSSPSLSAIKIGCPALPENADEHVFIGKSHSRESPKVLVANSMGPRHTRSISCARQIEAKRVPAQLS
jgi:hypothetical protein